MGNGTLHEHTDLPCVLLGKLGGTVTAGQHIASPGTPMRLTVLDKVGVSVAAIGDSTGRLSPRLPHGGLGRRRPGNRRSTVSGGAALRMRGHDEEW